MLHRTALISADAAALSIEEIYRTVYRYQDSIRTPSLLTGHLGTALFYYLYAQHSRKQDCLSLAKNRFEKALQIIISQPGSSVNSSFHELSLVANFLGTTHVLEQGDGKPFSILDSCLLNEMRTAFQNRYVGGFSCGALCFALHFLNRAFLYPRRYKWVIDEIIHELGAAAISGPTACHWCHDQHYSATLWNGQAAVILFLTRAAELKLAKKETVSKMLVKAIYFLLSQQRHQATTDLLSVQIGDLGIGYALLRAGQAFKNASWQSVGLQILGARAGKTLTIQGSDLPLGILNGAAGAATIFEKIYALTANPLFTYAAERSYNALLSAPLPSDAGHPSSSSGIELSFATGVSGIGAALIQMLHPQKVNLQPLLWLI